MKRGQKIGLILFAVIDLLVIGVLGAVVWSNQSTPSTPLPMPSPCAAQVLGRLPAALSPAISWDHAEVYITVTANYTSPSPPPSSAQLIWPLLDSMESALKLGCPLPLEATLMVNAYGTEHTLHHIARLPGEALHQWAAGAYTHDELAVQGYYRQITE